MKKNLIKNSESMLSMFSKSALSDLSTIQGGVARSLYGKMAR